MNEYFRLAHARRSVRAYLPQAVPAPTLQQLMTLARLAPSGSNVQPGHFIAVQGAVRQRLSEALTQAWRSGQPQAEDYSYFPDPLPMRWRKRQMAAAQALYGALGIERADRARRDAQFACNYRFFDAPVALVVCMEPGFGSGAYMDLGMSLYGLMLAAQSLGLASCAIGALACYPAVVREQLALPAGTAVVCGMALGYADPAAAVNQTRTQRTPLAEYFQVMGDETDPAQPADQSDRTD